MSYRISKHLVDATVNVITKDGEEHTVNINNIPCTWVWEDITREAAELWAVIDYVADNFDFESFSVVSTVSTKAFEQ